MIMCIAVVTLAGYNINFQHFEKERENWDNKTLGNENKLECMFYRLCFRFP